MEGAKNPYYYVIICSLAEALFCHCAMCYKSMSKFVAATSYRRTSELIYKLFIKFHKILISRFWLILFLRPAVKGHTGRKFFPHKACDASAAIIIFCQRCQQVIHTMVVSWPRMSRHRFWRRPSYLVYILDKQALYGIRASQWIKRCHYSISSERNI